MVDAILARLNEALERRGLPPIEGEAIHWVFDDSVTWGETSSVDRDDLLEAPHADRRIRERAEGASWVHANLARASDGRPLVAVNVGARVGNPRPTVNVSLEHDRVVTLGGDRGEDRPE